MNKDAYPYEGLWDKLETGLPYRQQILDTDKGRWLEQTFCLCALGNSLSEKHQWAIEGMDAIEYAIIRRYSWPVAQVREMDPRDKWLSLHEDLAGLQLAPGAMEVWKVRQQSSESELLNVWKPYPYGFPMP